MAAGALLASVASLVATAPLEKLLQVLQEMTSEILRRMGDIYIYIYTYIYIYRVACFDYPKVDLNPGVVDFPNREAPEFKSTLG